MFSVFSCKPRPRHGLRDTETRTLGHGTRTLGHRDCKTRAKPELVPTLAYLEDFPFPGLHEKCQFSVSRCAPVCPGVTFLTFLSKSRPMHGLLDTVINVLNVLNRV